MTCISCISRKIFGTVVFAAWSVALVASATSSNAWADDRAPLVTPEQFERIEVTDAVDIPVADYMKRDLSSVDIPLGGALNLSVMEEFNRAHFANFDDYDSRPRPIAARVARGDFESYESATRASANIRIPF